MRARAGAGRSAGAPRARPRQEKPQVGLKELGNYEKVLETFKRYDTDRNGSMSFKEMHKLMCDLNPGRWTEADSDRLLPLVDKNRNGNIDVNEFIAFIFEGNNSATTFAPAGMSQYEKVLQQFRLFDTNRNGTLDKAEFTRLMSSLQPGRWSVQATEMVFQAVDLNNSGEVDMDELVAYLFGVPKELQKNAQKNHGHGPLLIIEFVIGPGNPESYVQQMANRWKRDFGDEVAVSRIIKKDVKGIVRVTTRNGEIVFWDDASMLPYRPNPFLTMESLKAWIDDMSQRHMPRLLSGTKAVGRSTSKESHPVGAV